MTSAITLFRVAALCLLAGAAHASPVRASVPAPADAGAAVPSTLYKPAVAYQAPAAEPVTPERAWREQNRIVAAQDATGAAAHAGHAGHAMHGNHAGHTGHAVHGAPAPAAADPHAGHQMHGAAADPHAGHQMHGAAASGGAPSKPGCACCKDGGHAGMDAGTHAAMAMGDAPAAQCGAMAGGAQSACGGCCKDGAMKDCCKGGAMKACCSAGAAQSCAPAKPAHGAGHAHGAHS